MNQTPPELSLVIAVMNEEDNIHPLIDAVGAALSNFSYEVIFVDDGSKDQTIARIRAHSNPNVRVIELMKNFGQSTAMQAGIDEALGEYIVTLDGDLQNDPADIPLMLQTLKEGQWDLVAGERVNRKDGMFLRKIPSNIANSIIRRSTNVRIRDYGCTLKVFKKEIAKGLNLYGELHRFIPVLASLQGARITQVAVKHHPRIHGSSKYNLNRTFKVISDLMFMIFLRKYMQKPMHLFGTAGFITFGIGVLINLYFLIQKLAGADIWGKPMLLLGILLLLGGIQLITIGIIAEILMRTYYESQNKKTYSIRAVHHSGN